MIIKNFCASVVIILFCSAAYAQDASPTPSPTPVLSEEERALDEKIRIKTKQQQLVTLEQQIRAAQPSPTATPLSGDASGVNNLRMEASFQTYKSIAQITDRIACEIRTVNPAPSVLIMYRPEEYSSWRSYKSLDAFIKQGLLETIDEYDAWQEKRDIVGNVDLRTVNGSSMPLSSLGASASVGLLGITNITRSVADLLAMFRTNVDYSAITVAVQENTVRSMVTKSLKSKTCEGVFNPTGAFTIYDPVTFFPNDPLPVNSSTPYVSYDPQVGDGIVAYLRSLNARKRVAEIEVTLFDLEVADIEKLSTQLNSTEEKISLNEIQLKEKQVASARLAKEILAAKGAEKVALQAQQKTIENEEKLLQGKLQLLQNQQITTKARLSPLVAKMSLNYRLKIARLRQLNSEVAKIQTEMNAVDTTTKISPLLHYVKMESLDKIIDANNVGWLEVRTVDSGGFSRVQKNLLRYFYKPDVTFSGGSIVEFSLSDKNGKVLVANTDRAYEKYRHADKIQ